MGVIEGLPWNDRSGTFGTWALARLAPGATFQPAVCGLVAVLMLVVVAAAALVPAVRAGGRGAG